MKRGEIYWAWVPYNDVERGNGKGKVRPVVVIGASPMGAGEDQVVLVVPISDVGTPAAGDIPLFNVWNYGLEKDGVYVRARRLFGADPKIVHERIGELDQDTFRLVLAEVLKLFA